MPGRPGFFRLANPGFCSDHPSFSGPDGPFCRPDPSFPGFVKKGLDEWRIHAKIFSFVFEMTNPPTGGFFCKYKILISKSENQK